MIRGKMMKKKIFFGYDNWIIGGVEKTLVNLMVGLSEEFDVTLIIPEIDIKKQYYKVPLSIKVIEVKKDKELYKVMAQKIVENNADLFVGNGNMNCEFLKIYLYEQNIPSIMVNHNFWDYPYMHEAFLSEIAETRNKNIIYPNMIVCLTQIASYICKKATGKQVYTIGNMNIKNNKRVITWNEKENIILAIARFNDPVKRLDIILNFFSKIYKKNKSTKMIVVGTMNYEKIYGEKIIDTLKQLELPEDSVCFEGEQKQVEKYYNRAKIFLFASEAEGFGLVLNEAAGYGVPIISNYYLGVEDIITNGKNGFYYDETQEKEIDQAVHECIALLQDKEKWEKMSTYAFEMTEQFSEKRIIEKWKYVIYKSLNIQIEDMFTMETEYIPSQKEYEKYVMKSEMMMKDMVVRINRSDNAQNMLRYMYEREKEEKKFNFKEKIIKKLCMKYRNRD